MTSAPLMLFRERPVPPDQPIWSGPEFGTALYSRAERLRTDALSFHLDVLLTSVRFAETVQTLGFKDSAQRAYSRAATGYLKVVELLANGRASQDPALAWKLERLRSLLPEAPVPGCITPSDEAPVAGGDGLTPREIQVLKLIAEGNSSKQVAFQLGISFKTAVCHRYNVMEKLNIHDVSSLVRYAIRTGIVQP